MKTKNNNFFAVARILIRLHSSPQIIVAAPESEQKKEQN